MRTVRVSVRTLVEFLLRSGDIRGGAGAGPGDRKAMLAGSRIHRMIQGRRGGGYRAEVPLKREADFEAPECHVPYKLVVEGRADGILEDGGRTVIEEIKGVYLNIEDLEEPVPVHLAQAKCYAAIYGKQQGLDTIGIMMTYCSLETEQTVSFEMSFETGKLCEWFDALCEEYSYWTSFEIDWEHKRNASMERLTFPFDYRKGQQDMVKAVYLSASRCKNLFVQAPTGIGKTISALYPAVRALGEGQAEKIFYATARTITRTVAEETFRLLQERGLCMKSLTMTAKEKLCPYDQVICDPSVCPRARGHYDRVNQTLYTYLTEGARYDREEILRVSEEHAVCPYELQRDLASFMDAVICDYNYVFDPKARLGAWFSEGAPKGAVLLLVDEAHNLAERGREMFSASIEREDFLKIRRLCKKAYPGFKHAEKIAAACRACGEVLRDYRKECLEQAEEQTEKSPAVHLRRGIEALAVSLISLSGHLEAFLALRSLPGAETADLSDADVREEILNFYFEISFFMEIYEELDEHYLICGEAEGSRAYRLRLYCADPSLKIQEVLDRCRSTVFYSATLLPVKYYESLLTTKTDSYELYLTSPFSRSRRKLLIGTDVSTLYSMRGPAQYRKIAGYIEAVSAARAGNYLVYFPSYRMLEDVFDAYCGSHPLVQEDSGVSFETWKGGGTEVLLQRQGMRERDREAFLNSFSDEVTGTRIGFCVMGGMFSEGIDLTGERLIGVVVVGTGLPGIGPERELLRDYYDQRGLGGFDYAYRLPGMNKVLQAAGRVIRTAEDAGVIVLLDSRFGRADYRGLFPPEWSDAEYITLEEAGEKTGRFWSSLDASE